jgi:DNA recombination protein RmuC
VSIELGVGLLVALAIVNLAAIGWLLLRSGSRNRGADAQVIAVTGRFDAIERHNEVLRRNLTDMDQGLRGEIAKSTRDGFAAAFDKVQAGTQAQAESLGNVQQALNQLADTVRSGFDGFSQRLRDEQEQLRGKVDAKLEEIRTGNEAKLEQMRLTVDEKLQTTLEQRLGASFKQVSDSLEQVYKSVGEMQALAVGVGDLKRVLTNIKSRGTWTEIWLETILAEVLTPDQYGRNVEVLPGSNQRVEFALRLPGDETTSVWLPIDVKFPKDDYERLADAANRGDQAEVEKMARAIEVQIRASAREIRTKYIQPPHSTDFAVMFLPTEGLFAEVVRRPGLVEALQRECHIMVAGPTTLTTLLTAVRMGFRSLAIQKRSTEVWKVLGAVKHEFSNFGGFIDKISKKLGEAQKVIDDDLGRRRRAMDRSLQAVENLPEGEAAALLGYDGADNQAVLELDPDEPRAAAE